MRDYRHLELEHFLRTPQKTHILFPLDYALLMGAIYNIYFECELSGRNHIIAPNNSLFIALYGNYHQCSRALC